MSQGPVSIRRTAKKCLEEIHKMYFNHLLDSWQIVWCNSYICHLLIRPEQISKKIMYAYAFFFFCLLGITWNFCPEVSTRQWGRRHDFSQFCTWGAGLVVWYFLCKVNKEESYSLKQIRSLCVAVLRDGKGQSWGKGCNRSWG